MSKTSTTAWLAAFLLTVGPGCSADAQDGAAADADGTVAVVSQAAEGEASVESAATSDLLTIGSIAPPLDIQHWVQDGQGAFEPITAFKPGQVYVVEFWATWCGPCIDSIPHLSELQQRYRDQGVTIVSISSEPLETVTAFLDREVRGQFDDDGEPLTFDHFTKHYCLTTDPDRSVNEAYMDGAKQSGIPAAFLVGKDGRIEWIGHPARIADPLEQVVADVWDREAFGKDFRVQQELEATVQNINMMLRLGRTDEARQQLADLAAKATSPALKAQVKSMQVQVEYSIFQQQVANDQSAAAAQLPTLVEMVEGEARAINAFTWAVAQYGASGAEVSPELLSAAEAAVASALDETNPENPSMLDTLGHLIYLQGDLDRAIEVQQQASATAEGELKSQIDAFLAQMTAELEGSVAEK